MSRKLRISGLHLWSRDDTEGYAVPLIRPVAAEAVSLARSWPADPASGQGGPVTSGPLLADNTAQPTLNSCHRLLC